MGSGGISTGNIQEPISGIEIHLTPRDAIDEMGT